MILKAGFLFGVIRENVFIWEVRWFSELRWGDHTHGVGHSLVFSRLRHWYFRDTLMGKPCSFSLLILCFSSSLLCSRLIFIHATFPSLKLPIFWISLLDGDHEICVHVSTIRRPGLSQWLQIPQYLYKKLIYMCIHMYVFLSLSSRKNPRRFINNDARKTNITSICPSLTFSN